MRAYVFPGQGTQKKGMGRGLFDEFRDLTKQTDKVLGYSIETLCLEDKNKSLIQTQFTQPALYVVNAFHYLTLVKNTESRPDYLAGHSLGEYNALFAAGAFDFITGLKLVKERSILMSHSSGGAMAAVVGLTENELITELNKNQPLNVAISNYNAPTQFVLSGYKKDIEKLKTIFMKSPRVKLYMILNTSGAFHSFNMLDAKEKYNEFLSGFEFFDLSIPVISNVTARPYEKGDIKKLLGEQITHPVKWIDSIKYLMDVGVEDFEEIGESQVLSALINQIKQVPLVSKPMDIEKESSDISSIDKKEEIKLASPLLVRILERSKEFPNKVLQIFQYDDNIEKITGAELSKQVQNFGSILINQLASQDMALLLFPQGSAYVISLLSCWYANVVVIPTPVTDVLQFEIKAPVIHAIIKNSGARVILTNNSFEKQAKQIADDYGLKVINIDDDMHVEKPHYESMRDVHAGDLSLVLYTSGSTSQPKGVMLGHEAIFNTATSTQWGMSEKSRVVSWLPQFHAFGISFGLLAPLAHGAMNVVCPPEHFIREPLSWLKLMHEYKATHTGAPSFSFGYCCESIHKDISDSISLDSLQSIVCGGDIINLLAYEKFLKQFSGTGLKENVLTPNYGLSEAGPITVKKIGKPVKFITLDKKSLERKNVKKTSSNNGSKVIVSCGETDDATKILIVDPDTTELCQPNTIGEIWLKSPCQGLGYLNDAETTQSIFNGIVKATGDGGFLRTGDLGFIDKKQLYIVGREKDVIIVNGKNYYSADIETEIRENVNGCSLACAVFSCEVDEIEKVIVVQEVDQAPSNKDYASIADEIIGTISEMNQLEVYDVVLVERGVIPVTGSKKVRRKLCKENYLDMSIPFIWKYRQQIMPDLSVEKNTYHSIIQIQKEIMENVFVPEIGKKALALERGFPFSRLGLDSIRYIRLARKIESVFNTKFRPGMFYQYKNCAELADYLMTQNTLEKKDLKKSNLNEFRDEYVIGILRKCAQGDVAVEHAVKMIRERI